MEKNSLLNLVHYRNLSKSSLANLTHKTISKFLHFSPHNEKSKTDLYFQKWLFYFLWIVNLLKKLSEIMYLPICFPRNATKYF